MSEEEKINFRAKLNQGLKQSYELLLRRKAALGQDMVIADADGQPVVVPAKELLQKEERANNIRLSDI